MLLCQNKNLALQKRQRADLAVVCAALAFTNKNFHISAFYMLGLTKGPAVLKLVPLFEPPVQGYPPPRTFGCRAAVCGAQQEQARHCRYCCHTTQSNGEHRTFIWATTSGSSHLSKLQELTLFLNICQLTLLAF